MNTVTPFYIPVNTDTKPDRCPKCHKEEEQVFACKHCGYVYPEEKMSKWMTLVVVALTWVVFTLIWWLADNITSSGSIFNKKSTLLEIIIKQIDFFTSLKIW